MLGIFGVGVSVKLMNNHVTLISISLSGSDSDSRNFSNYKEWVDSGCDGYKGKPFSVGHQINESNTSNVKLFIGVYAGDKDQCVTMVGKVQKRL